MKSEQPTTQFKKILELLDNYYGNSRNRDRKHEIAHFIINFYNEITFIMKEPKGDSYARKNN